MPVNDDASRAVLDALDSARGVRQAGAGLVVVMLRGTVVAAVLHRREPTVDARIAAIAGALEADRAVLIVVGSAKLAGAIILAADAVAAQLSGADVAVCGRIHVRALAEGAMIWTDLSERGGHDGAGVPRAEIPDRLTASTGRPAGVLPRLRGRRWRPAHRQ